MCTHTDTQLGINAPVVWRVAGLGEGEGVSMYVVCLCINWIEKGGRWKKKNMALSGRYAHTCAFVWEDNLILVITSLEEGLSKRCSAKTEAKYNEWVKNRTVTSWKTITSKQFLLEACIVFSCCWKANLLLLSLDLYSVGHLCIFLPYHLYVWNYYNILCLCNAYTCLRNGQK